MNIFEHLTGSDPLQSIKYNQRRHDIGQVALKFAVVGGSTALTDLGLDAIGNEIGQTFMLAGAPVLVGGVAGLMNILNWHYTHEQTDAQKQQREK